MPNGNDKQPWYWWLKENVWPWEQPTGVSGLEKGAFARTRTPVAASQREAWVTPRTTAITRTPEYQAQEEWRREMVTGGYTPAGMPPSPVEEARKAVEAVTGEPKLGPPGWETFAEASGQLPNENWEIYRNEFGRFDIRRKATPAPMPTGLTPAQKEQYRLQEEAAEAAEAQREAQRTQWEWERGQAETAETWRQEQAQAEEDWRQTQLDWQKTQAGTAGTQWQQQLDWQQEQFQQQMDWYLQQAQMQQQEQERQERARLMASPMSWLQYASYTGEEPIQQPWMQPLMAGQYQAGQPIAGWTPESGAGMQALTTPSAQLWGRMGPTAQAGFAGYQQAQQGIRPEELAFRMGAGAPPGGRATSLRWTG